MPEENPRRKRSIIPTIITIIVVALVAAGGYWAWSNFMSVEPEPQPAPIVETPQAPQNSTYASSTMKFSLTYPQAFTLQEQYAYTRVSPTKPISGVTFAVPSTFTQGTNLASDSGIAVEQLPRATACTGDIYLKANVKAQSVTEGAITYSLATSTETAGTDVFEEMVYAIPGSSPCIAVRYFLHSNAIGNMATGTRAFDRAGVIAAFDTIRRSMSVQ